jgi:hypothetical protein
MRKRLRRKKHKALLPDVVHDISVSNLAGQILVDGVGQNVLLTSATVQKMLPGLARDLARWKLKFVARTVATGAIADSWIDDGVNIVFEFRALEFSKIKNWSGNNPSRFKPPSDK